MSPCNPNRPRLPEPIEDKFANTDKLSAMAYTLLEHNTALIDELMGAVVQGEMDITDSLIHDVRHVVQPERLSADAGIQDAGRPVVDDKDEHGRR